VSALEEAAARVAVHAEAVHDDLDAHVAHGNLSVAVGARELQHHAAQVQVLARANRVRHRLGEVAGAASDAATSTRT